MMQRPGQTRPRGQGGGKVPGGMPNRGIPGYGDPMNGVGQGGGMGGGRPQFGGGRPQAGGQGGGFGGQSWQDRGFESQDAARSVQRQYGLVQGENGGWERPDSAFLQRQMDAQGWGIQDQQGALNNGTPVAIGGARWLMGANGMDFTGQASDVPFQGQPLGQAYNAGQQAPYGGGQTRPRRTRTFGQVMQ